jgi:hypothetical protein
LTCWDRSPLGPPQLVSDSCRLQVPADFLCVRGSGRLRRCLLKGCERWFRPAHPRCCYCCDACCQAADRWSRWRACWCYRRSEGGRERRREQARRYRQRVKTRQEAEEQAESPSREGHEKESRGNFFPCSRPGCYELFEVSTRSPCQKFCSCLCRQALRAVRVRQRRYAAAPTASGVAETTASARGP